MSLANVKPGHSAVVTKIDAVGALRPLTVSPATEIRVAHLWQDLAVQRPDGGAAARGELSGGHGRTPHRPLRHRTVRRQRHRSARFAGANLAMKLLSCCSAVMILMVGDTNQFRLHDQLADPKALEVP